MTPVTSINLKLMQSFVLVAEQSSFRNAAILTRHSQSAISAQIKRLEEQLGVRLFHRTTRQVQLTPEGEQLLSCARRALTEVEGGLREIQGSRDLKRGRVSFACSPTIALAYLAPILAKFESDYPGIEVFVQENSSTPLMESIRRREVDFGIGPVVHAPDVQFDVLMEDPIYALVSERFELEDTEAVSLKQLAQFPLLLLDPSTALRQMIDESAAKAGLTLKTPYQFRQAQTLISMAEWGLGIAILPKVALTQRANSNLRFVPIVEPRLTRQFAIATLRGHRISPAASRLIPLFRQMADTHLSAPMPPLDRAEAT